MAEKTEKKPAAAPAKEASKDDGHGKAAAKGGGIAAMMTKTPVMLGGIMLLEATVLFAGFKFVGGGPKQQAGAAVILAEGQGGGEGGEGGPTSRPVDGKAPAELQIVEFRAPNAQTGRTFVYDLSIYAVVKTKDLDRAKTLVAARDALIRDRVRTIVGEMDPQKLGGGTEPGLETLRRQVKYQLDQILGDGLIDEVLVPRCIPFRTDY